MGELKVAISEAEGILLYILLQHPKGAKMSNVVKDIRRMSFSQAVAHQLGCYVKCTQQRTYVLRRLRRLESKLLTRREGTSVQGTRWFPVPANLQNARICP